MMDKNDNLEMVAEDVADELLQKLFHLKSYEIPDSERMTRNKQNIMRRVREVNSRTRWDLFDLLEVNIPWFFAEPKYGIAALFIAFASLQYLGVSSRHIPNGQTGIYTASDQMASLDRRTTISTNMVSYPELPDNLNLFPNQQGDDGVKFVGRRVEPTR